jgi:hypothetical protein
MEITENENNMNFIWLDDEIINLNHVIYVSAPYSNNSGKSYIIKLTLIDGSSNYNRFDDIDSANDWIKDKIKPST